MPYENFTSLTTISFLTRMAPSSSQWSLYIIRCGDRSLYTGISNDVETRFAMHQSGHRHSAKYLRGRHPLSLVYQVEIGTKSDASQAEYHIKKLPKSKKEQLILGEIRLEDIWSPA